MQSARTIYERWLLGGPLASPLIAAVADIEATAEVGESTAWAKVKAAVTEREDAFVRRGYMLDNLRTSLAAAGKERDAAQLREGAVRRALGATESLTTIEAVERIVAQRNNLRNDVLRRGEQAETAIKERDEARARWAEQSADAARLRLALEKSQQQLVQAHEDIDALIAKQTATDHEVINLSAQVRAEEERARVFIAGYRKSRDNWQGEAQHHARIVGRLLDEMARGYFVDRFLDPSLYADALKAAGREVKP